jgi:hypothetical protein
MHPPRAGALRPTPRRRAGITAVLAMLYMVLFAALAVGFYVQTTLAAHVGHNEQRMLHARTAAESGMEFMRYQLQLVQVPPLTPDDEIMDVVFKDLTNRLELTGNLGKNVVYMNGVATRIEVPEGENNSISLYEKGPRFRAIIVKKGRDLVVTTVGSPSPTGPSGRAAIELTFRPTQERGSFFSHGMASRGGMVISSNDGLITGNPPDFGSVLSMGALTIGPGGAKSPAGISGEIFVPTTIMPTLNGAVSVDGETDSARILAAANDHVNYLAPEDMPEYPVADTTAFKQFATNKYVAGKTVYDNTLIPPNTNPSFSAGQTIRGVLFIQQPNAVKFTGGVILHAIIATEDVGAGTLATNVLEFTGSGVAKEPVSTLPLSEHQFDGIRGLAGSFIVSPGFDLKISGNFSTAVGDICADRITIGGGADVNIAGSIYTLKPYPLTISGSASVSVKFDPNSLHSGVRHTEAFYSLPSTWREIIVP